MNAIARPAPSALDALNDWVASVASLTKPDRIHWCDGSDAENAGLSARMEALKPQALRNVR